MDTINHMSSDCNGKYDTNIEDEAGKFFLVLKFFS